MSQVVYAYVRKLKNPHGVCACAYMRDQLTQAAARTRIYCPTLVQLASLAPHNTVIPRVVGQCSTVQVTARQRSEAEPSGIPLNRAGVQARGLLERG